MNGNGDENLKMQYLEAVRLHVWYSDSPFSFHKGKASREMAMRQKNTFHELFDEYVKTCG
jgi:hypothetical protein